MGGNGTIPCPFLGQNDDAGRSSGQARAGFRRACAGDFFSARGTRTRIIMFFYLI
jgi:hypothetical protein